MTDVIGWASSAVLLVTLLVQIRAQWRARHTESVSPWLFLGQLAANLGFIVYSLQVGSAVFVATNSALALVAITGLVTLLVHRRRERRGAVGRSSASPDRSARPPGHGALRRYGDAGGGTAG